MAEGYLRTDEIEDCINSIEFCARIATTLDTTPANWKWCLIGAHSAVQAALVRVLNGSAGIGALDKKCRAEWLAWFEKSRVDPKVDPPREWLADFQTLLKWVTDPARMDEFGGKELQLSPDLEADMKRLNELRRDFIHFTPKSWSIELAGLPRLMRSAIGIVKELMLTHPSCATRIEPDQRKRLMDAVDRLEMIFHS